MDGITRRPRRGTARTVPVRMARETVDVSTPRSHATCRTVKYTPRPVFGITECIGETLREIKIKLISATHY
ncbi:hypothetical protein [Saccharopolyspora rosea]|uniref:hypothetical protein n=1 Tax=Saccharopolyspora rosea TaxID=524884 RepID=UPI0021D8D7AC|nr:hypothetical protein [Saccharopolyspora rosea]